MVDVGESPPSDGIGGIPKRTLLIGAVVIGGAIGLFVFISRKASAPSTTAENKAQTTVPSGSLTLAYQNLAEQLLGFRGDVSVANANLAQGEQDLMSQLGAESADRAAGNTDLMGGIQSVLSHLSDVSSGQTLANGNILTSIRNTAEKQAAAGAQQATASNNIMAAVWQVFYRQAYPGATWDQLVTQNPYLAANPANPSTAATGDSITTSPVNGSQSGAGGATPRDAIMAAFGANEDDSHYYLAHMSAGPVRQLTNRRY